MIAAARPGRSIGTDPDGARGDQARQGGWRNAPYWTATDHATAGSPTTDVTSRDVAGRPARSKRVACRRLSSIANEPQPARHQAYRSAAPVANSTIAAAPTASMMK